MNVYILSRGERGEGSSAVAAYSTLAKAKARARKDSRQKLKWERVGSWWEAEIDGYGIDFWAIDRLDIDHD